MDAHQRAQRRETLVDVRVVPLDHGDRRHGLAGNGRGFAPAPVLHIGGLRQFAGRIVLHRYQHDVLLLAQHFGRDVGEGLGQPLVDFPVAAAFPHRIDRRAERMDEGMHVGGVEVVLFVPGGRRQHDVGIDAGRGHAEVERHQQIEFSFRRFVMPDDVLGLLLAGLAQILALHAMGGAEQMLEEIFVALAARTQKVGAPDEEIARPVLRIVRIVAGHLQAAGFDLVAHIVLGILAGRLGGAGDIQRIVLQAAAPTAASPCARRAR